MKSIILAALVVTLTACGTVQPRVADENGCRAIEGSYAKMDRKGNLVYKHICAGKVVWLSQR